MGYTEGSGSTAGRRAAIVAAVLVLAAAVAAAVTWPAAARAASTTAWCGTVSPSDRPELYGGRQISVLYAIASDGIDRSAEVAPLISSDVDEIEAWWQLQDSSRVPRFDRVAFPCGPQVDIRLLRLPQPLGELTNLDPIAMFERVDGATDALATGDQSKYLVYVDVPFQSTNVCGVGGGLPDGSGLATIILSNCTGDIRTSTVATHELLHSFGALPRSGPPHPCPESPAHPCDQTGDILYLYAQPAPLTSFALDVGHDDYYAHSGGWFDLQDSKWLRHLDSQVDVDLRITGGGTVKSSLSGIDCSSSCVTQWDSGERTELIATPAEGLRFVRWTGGCTGLGPSCSLLVNGAQQISALFGPATFTLRTTIRGRGRVVASRGAASCAATCSRSVPSYTSVTLKPVASKGWKFSAWRGVCTGKARTCTVPMTAAASVTAMFVRTSKR